MLRGALPLPWFARIVLLFSHEILLAWKLAVERARPPIFLHLEERAALGQFFATGLADTFHHFRPDESGTAGGPEYQRQRVQCRLVCCHI